MTEDNMEAGPSSQDKPKKQPKRGIIYLSSIPPYMNVTKIREIFGQYGKVGRVYLQLANTEPKPGEKKSKKKHIAKKFTEGWVEFERKSTAKKVAALLNNQQVSTRKKSKHYDCIWNMKYLSHFKWTHLHERLAYEKAARRQKLRAETQLAKKKTDFFTLKLDKKKKNKEVVNRELENIESKKANPKESTKTVNIEDRKKLLASVFS